MSCAGRMSIAVNEKIAILVPETRRRDLIRILHQFLLLFFVGLLPEQKPCSSGCTRRQGGDQVRRYEDCLDFSRRTRRTSGRSCFLRERTPGRLKTPSGVR